MDEFDEIFPNLLQKITHSGKKQLDHENIRKIEELISPSVKHCKQSHQHIMKHLEKKHAEVRFSTLLVCDHLVRFSKVFRKNLIGEDLTNFLELTMGTNKSRPLPPPKNVAKDLRSQAISIIYKWHEDFGKDFVELANAFYYLKDCIKVDFKAIEKQKIAEKLKAQMEKKRLEEKKEERMKKALVEFKSFFDEAQRLCTELENCISLLIPPPEDFFLPLNPADAINSEPGTSSDLRSHGIVTPGISIPIQVSKAVPKLVIDEDNQPIVENAQEIFSQLNKGHVKRVASWTEIFSDNRDHAGKFQSCKVLNEQLKKCLNQFEDLGLKKSRRGQSVSSEEEDFEEVEPKEGYEEKVKEDLLSVMIAKKEQKKEEKSEPNVKPVAKKPKIFEKPVEKVSTNIEDWEKKQLELPPVIVGIRPDNSQVWIGPSFEDEEVKVPVIESCPVDYSRTFEPVKWSCRAPLPNGTLCPRQDRIKCPFHGRIVPRDESGKCVREEDATREQLMKEQHERENPEWQDPKLLAELKRTTGIDLEMPKKGKRRKKQPEFPGLTDLSAKKDSPRKRLARKVLTKSEMKQLKSKLEVDFEDKKKQEFYASSDEYDS